jgi:predicted outer membrane repeat protein
MVNDASLEMTNPTLQNGRARRYGGAIYAGGTGTFFTGAT